MLPQTDRGGWTNKSKHLSPQLVNRLGPGPFRGFAATAGGRLPGAIHVWGALLPCDRSDALFCIASVSKLASILTGPTGANTLNNRRLYPPQ